MAARLSRIRKELEMLATDPGPGISAWPANDNNMMQLEAQIQGPQDSPYQEGLYTLKIDIPDRYPFEPPRVRFLTPIYHPNIDSDGRICLDTLKMQPHGSWSPSININTLLLTIRVLMSNPNADDGLVPDITEEYKRDINLWRRKALDHTKLNAIPKATSLLSTENSFSSEMLQHPSAIVESNNTSSNTGNAADDTSENESDSDGEEEAEEEEEEEEEREGEDVNRGIPNQLSIKRVNDIDHNDCNKGTFKIARKN
jgi:ubiquitin-conjugating enzyme E2 T